MSTAIETDHGEINCIASDSDIPVNNRVSSNIDSCEIYFNNDYGCNSIYPRLQNLRQ